MGVAYGRDYSAESVARAKRKVRRCARYHGLDRILTLTFPGEGEHEYGKAQRVLSRFIHDHGELVHRGRYVWVPELHPGGHGWHFHILRKGGCTREELGALQRAWTRFCISSGYSLREGTRFVRIHMGERGSSRSAACYAAKYLGKSMAEGHLAAGSHRYEVSEGCRLPEPDREWYPTKVRALWSCAHPLFWTASYDGMTEGKPFFWLAIDPDPL